MPDDPEIQWCLDLQKWAYERYLEGHPLAILGMYDALGEEIMIRLEREKDKHDGKML